MAVFVMVVAVVVLFVVAVVLTLWERISTGSWPSVMTSPLTHDSKSSTPDTKIQDTSDASKEWADNFEAASERMDHEFPDPDPDDE